jgi:hypothetical protein
MYKIELVDADFDYIVHTQLVGTNADGNNTFDLKYDVFTDIPYCLKVTAMWHSEEANRNMKVGIASTCWTQNSNWNTA